MSIHSRFQQSQDRVLITSDGGDNNITISRDLGGHLFANGALPAAELFGGDGNDSLTGGSGADVISGQDGNDILFGHAGNDTLIGGDGNDVVDGDQGVDVGILGAGDDVFVWDNGDGSDRVEGGSGFDEMLFNGNTGALAEQFSLTADGDHALFTRVQGNIVMDLNDVEHVTLNPFGGADTITINDPSGTDISQIDLNLGFDGAHDTISINDDDDVTFINNGNGELTILGVSGATVHITGFEVGSDHLMVNNDVLI